MYIIKKIIIDEKERYIASEIIAHSRTITDALKLLKFSAKSFIKEECGKQVSDSIKIIDIHNFIQINEPVVDTMLIYRLDSDSHKLNIYQRKTKIIPGTIYGKSLVPEFRRIAIFELEEYTKLNFSELSKKNSQDVSTMVISSLPVEMVPIGPIGIKIPKPMTISPMRDLLHELKKSPKFNAQFNSVNSAPPAESAPDIKNVTKKVSFIETSIEVPPAEPANN
ncbi:MAG: hypothetical protein Satyrvirus52_1 [Satyrvirus sp.]|uniref:Uncharacterized protein n=1 Tax=Satyrvirus sp. TaxID=2487771 RepID=A0A3G5AF89_9VIRU|nr:MAG: hypothetical protein Satyrvirus52_1 [Satyrvirus sp.]